MIVDQAQDGIEVLRGSAPHFDANWKLQAENGADGYHVTATHWNYAATQGRRTADGKEGHHQGHERRRLGSPGRRLLLVQERPHAAVDQLGQPGRPSLWGQARRVGRSSAKPAPTGCLSKSRNLCLYPNVYLMDQFSSQIRVLRLIVGRQDRGHHLLHRAEGRSAEARARRLRQYEDFFNATGMATPTTWKSSAPASTASTPASSSGTT